jgi:hypothetical protein
LISSARLSSESTGRPRQRQKQRATRPPMPGHRPSPPIDVQIGLWWSGSRRGGLPVLSSSRTINAQPSTASLPPPFFFHSHAVPSLTFAGEIRRAPSTSIKFPAPVPPSPPLTTPTTHPKLPPRRRAHLRWQSETPRPPFSLHRHTRPHLPHRRRRPSSHSPPEANNQVSSP